MVKVGVDIENLKKIADAQNNAMRRRFSTHTSAYNYKVGQLQSLNSFIYVLIWAYFILAAIYLWKIYVSSESAQYTFYYKLAILIVLVLFPYVITPIEMFFIRMIAYIVETIIGNVFNRPDYEYVIDYSYIPTVFSY